MRLTLRQSLIPLIFLFASCGRPLGTYEVSDVTLVPGSEVKKFEPFFDADSEMLRVAFKSTTDLNEASSGGDGLYVVTSFCPFDRERMIYIGGPYHVDGSRFGDQPIRPIKDASGKYLYKTYLRPAMMGRPEQPGKAEQIAYDLRRAPSDLCMQIEQPDMVIIPSVSKTFVVPAASIRRAFVQRSEG